MIDFYQHLPEKIDPIAFSVGSFNIHWYALMYLLAFIVVYFLLLHRLKKKETSYSKNLIFDLLLYLFLGLLIGGRLGYVLFYNFSYYASHPLAIISPFSSVGSLTGIYGMSYFGGLIGAVLAGYLFCWKNKISFIKMADFIIPAIPAGYFFGRIGNFLNGELYGRATDMPWGMYFSDGILRHPSQLYEAFFEGLVLFMILWTLRNNKKLATCYLLPATYLFGYGFFRFFIEFFREPDPQIRLFLSFLTLGQVFSLILLILSLILCFRNYKKYVKIASYEQEK